MPEATPVVRTALMSRVPVYLTLAPVWASQGATIARNESCSAPVHVPMTETSPPIWPPPLGDASPLAGALAGGALAPVDPAGLLLAVPDEQAAAMIAAAASRPATLVRRYVRSSMSFLLSRIVGPVFRPVSWVAVVGGVSPRRSLTPSTTEPSRHAR